MRKLFLASLLGLSATLAVGQGVITYDYVVKTEQRKVITEFERDAFVLGGRVEDFLSDPAPLDSARTTLTNLITKYADSKDTEVIVTDASGISVLTSDPVELAVGDDFTNRPRSRRLSWGTCRQENVGLTRFNRTWCTSPFPSSVGRTSTVRSGSASPTVESMRRSPHKLNFCGGWAGPPFCCPSCCHGSSRE